MSSALDVVPPQLGPPPVPLGLPAPLLPTNEPPTSLPVPPDMLFPAPAVPVVPCAPAPETEPPASPTPLLRPVCWPDPHATKIVPRIKVAKQNFSWSFMRPKGSTLHR